MGNVYCVCGGSWQDKKKNQEREEAGTESPDIIKEKFSLKKQYTSTVNPSETVVSCYTAFLENVVMWGMLVGMLYYLGFVI